MRVAKTAVALVLAVANPAVWSAELTEWPSWRGPEQNGISRERNLVEKWNPRGGAGSNVLWVSEELGGISTPIVLRGKLCTLVSADPGTKVEAEKVVCVDAATGKKLWENRFNVYLSDVPAERVGWGNCAGDPETGNIYAMGVCTLLQCLDGETGQTIWARSLSEEYGMLSTYGGRTNTPVVFEDLVIISGVTTGWGDVARPSHRFLAFDKRDGHLVWMTSTNLSPEDTTYSTPTIGVIGGQQLLVVGAGDGYVYAMQPRTGKVVWKYQLSRRGINVSAVIADDRVYIGHSEENPVGTLMGAVVAIDGRGTGDISKTGTIWRVEELMVGKASPLLVDGRLYVVDDSASLRVLDAANGEQIGEPRELGTAMRSSPIWAEGKIYAGTTNSIWAVLEPTEDGVRQVQRLRLPTGYESHGSPIVAHGRLYVPTTRALFCLGAADRVAAVSERPPAAAELAVDQDQTPALLQLVPAEVLLQPGAAVTLKARLFNARGQLLKETPAEYSVVGPGQVDNQGVFTAPAGVGHTASVVTAKVGELTGRAKIRVVPPLPWKFDFGDRQVPITWIGANYRHVPRDVAGEPMIVKVTTIPKGTRSQAWMGPTDVHDYTIQADVMGGQPGGRLPDIGLIAQRYTLDMQGESQQLQIRTWPPVLRMAKSVPFSWEPGVWYTMKLRAAVEGQRAVLRGKVWKRGEAEPTQWLVEATDDSPNLIGSPGLFGNATNAEIFIDNIVVAPN